ncbi:hypothetical protein F511_13024 [Dorcoceras hygrometricum]|uniref:Uncharacterized protein n=1 Tax=Dorcoceras hygrometricum TaxID=472368 RepID=A0A2Z7AMC7_9LAMI|nr:hypothetical protein F511_13024 [Dorcoceras hygrometricum]
MSTRRFRPCYYVLTVPGVIFLKTSAAPRETGSGSAAAPTSHAWDLGKEEFLMSSEFDTLCAKKALKYFKVGFLGSLAQFRANGYPEEEHTTFFLDVKKALMEMSEEDEAEEEYEEEDSTGDEAPSLSSPKQ